MALPTISPVNFSGFINISADTYSSSDFSAYITRGIRKHLRYLIGDSGYIDLDSNTRSVYTALLNGTNYTDSNGEGAVCDSLTEVLQLLIYSDWVQEGHIVNSSVGGVMNFNENASEQGGATQAGLVVKRLSEAGDFWESACKFIGEFRKVSKTITSVDNTDPLNPICTVSEATYLDSDDTVTILGVSYTAASVTATTFTVAVPTADLGLTFVDQIADWEPLRFVQDVLPEIRVGIF